MAALFPWTVLCLVQAMPSVKGGNTADSKRRNFFGAIPFFFLFFFLSFGMCRHTWEGAPMLRSSRRLHYTEYVYTAVATLICKTLPYATLRVYIGYFTSYIIISSTRYFIEVVKVHSDRHASTSLADLSRLEDQATLFSASREAQLASDAHEGNGSYPRVPPRFSAEPSSRAGLAAASANGDGGGGREDQDARGIALV